MSSSPTWNPKPFHSVTLKVTSRHFCHTCGSKSLRPAMLRGGNDTQAMRTRRQGHWCHFRSYCHTLPLVSLSTQSCAVGKQDYKAKKAASEQGVLALSFMASLSPSTTGSQPLSTCHTLLGKNRSASLLFLFLFLGSTI